MDRVVLVLNNRGAFYAGDLHAADREELQLQRGPKPYNLHPTPYTLNPEAYTLHPTPYTIHHTPYTIHPSSYTLHPTPYGPQPWNLNHPIPQPPNLDISTLNSEPLTGFEREEEGHAAGAERQGRGLRQSRLHRFGG